MTAIEKSVTLDDLVDIHDWLYAKVKKGRTRSDKIYDPGNPINCLVCQYLKDRGHVNPIFTGSLYVETDKGTIKLPRQIRTIAYGDDHNARSRDEPVMAALERAKIEIEKFKLLNR